MPRILLVKTSSLGDVVHNLPVVGDLRRYAPDAEIDWVVEEVFAAIPRMHPGVRRIIPVALREWRGELLSSITRDGICTFLGTLRACEYDAIIDTQGLLKSALIARAVCGACYGMDWRSSREPLRFLYDRTFSVPWHLHAVARNRGLAAQALGYAPLPEIAYGISAQRRAFQWLPDRRYAVLLHATSAENKLWPETNWKALCEHLLLNGIACVMPWGSDTERVRSQGLAATASNAIVPPVLTLDEVAALLAGAQGVVGVDTGLTHLAAALNVPTIGIYCTTDPAATGICGCPRAVNLGGIGTPPAVTDVVEAWTQLTG